MNDHACEEFCKHISHTFKADLQDSLRAAKFISIILSITKYWNMFGC